MFFKVLIIISVVSVLLSVLSLRNLNTKREVEETKTKLKKGRVIFQRSVSSPSSSSKSSSS